MGLRPKTARRLALIAGLLIIVVIGGLAVVTVPRWQRGRQIEAFKRDGLAAHRAGRHYEAVPLLNRHTKAVGEANVDPEVLLSLARSQAKDEAQRDSHISVAIQRYRAYLRAAPDDLTARRELLELLVRAQRWSEAVEMAERIGRDLPADRDPGQNAADLQLLRDELAARVGLNSNDARIPELRAKLLNAEPPAFRDVWDAFQFFAQDAKDASRAEGVLASYITAWPDETGARVLAIMQPRVPNETDPASAPTRRPLPDVIGDLEEMLGLDRDPTTSGEVTIQSERLPGILAGFFDMAGRPDLAAEVLSQSLAGPDSHKNTNDLARRLFWLGLNQPLFGLGIADDDRGALSDTIGYQMLAAIDAGDEERAGEAQRELESTSYEYKAKAWLGALQAKRAFDSGDLPGARAAIGEAIERYELEPTFRLLHGDIQNAMGFTSEALTAWTHASELSGSVPWPGPLVRRVSTLLTSDRMLAARELMQETLAQTRYRTDLSLLTLNLRVEASLARQGYISPQDAMAAALAGEQIRSQIESLEPDQDMTEIDLSLAGIYGSLNEPEEAARALARVLQSPGALSRAPEVLEIDQRYGLGLAGSMGTPELPDSMSDPAAALRATLTFTEGALRESEDNAAAGQSELDQRVARSLKLIDNGLGSAAETDRAAWLEARARYLDVFRTDEAGDAWRAAIQAAPKNIALLNAVVWSDALGKDTAFVDSTINTIRELTASQGRTLPATLRLARARAVFGDEPNRVRRDEAIGIVRSVIAAEPRNSKARLMLAQMLAADCNPIYTNPADRFEPNLSAAIDQYENIASQIQGNEAVGYYFQIIELANRLGDTGRAQRAVQDAIAVMGNGGVSVERLAKAIRDLGDRTAAARTLQAYFERTSGRERVRAGLALAETYAMIGDDAGSARVLGALSDAEDLSLAELTELTTRMTQNAMQEEVQSLLADPARFGLEASQIAAIRAGLIARFEPIDQATTELDALANSDPQNVEVWRIFISALLDEGRIDDAKARLDKAEAANPGDQTIALLRASASGDTNALARLTLTDTSSPRYLRIALDEVRAFETSRATMSRDEQLAALRALTTRFSRLAPVLNYTIVERESMGEDAPELAPDAFAAARSFPQQPTLLLVATRVSLAAGSFEEALGFATTWRGLVEGSRLEPDLYAAEAAQGLGRDARVLSLLNPYLQAALDRPSEPLHTAALLIHGGSSMRSGDGAAVRQRYEPVASSDAAFRAAVWVPLGGRWTTTAEDATAWLDAAQRWGMAGSETALAQGWIDAAQRFEAARVGLLQRAVEAASRAIVSDPTKADAYALRAGALRLLGLIEPESSQNWMRQAEEAFVEADRADPANLNMLFQAGRCAEDAGRYEAMQGHFEALLGRPGCTGLFAAGVKNNLVMAMVRQGNPTAAELARAAGLIQEAMAERLLPAFQSTRAWVRYLSGDLAGASEDFRALTQANPGNASAWAGLAFTARGDGGQPTPESKANWERARGLGLADVFVLELAGRAGFTSE